MGLKELADIKRIEILLDKYWQGESTREEEALLKDYFTSDHVADHLTYIQPLFVVWQQNKKRELGNNFDKDLRKKIGLKRKGPFFKASKPLSAYLIKIAATLILLLAATYLFYPKFTSRHRDDQSLQLGTFDDPKEAYEQVRKSLQLVSAKLNKGSGYVKELSRFDKGATLFNKQKKQKTQDE